MTVIFHLLIFLNKSRYFLLSSSYFADLSFLIVSIFFSQKIWVFHVELFPFRMKSFL